MGSDEFGSSPLDGISTKRLLIFALLAIFGAIMFIQVLAGFPLKDLFPKQITQDAKVILKTKDGICVVDTPDHPREIPNCQYNIGDVLVVTYREGEVPIDAYHLKGS
jgi:hypothetical protein